MTQRVQKCIAAAGLASRRAAEALIEQGRVTVNGRRASLGDSADPAVDDIRVDGERLHVASGHTYILLHKPKGYVTTMHDEFGRPTVAELTANAGGRLFPVGRLDRDSEGLLLLTDDGDAANALTHPGHEVDKVYAVWVRGDNVREKLAKLNRMRRLEGETIRPPHAVLKETDGQRSELEITIHEGKNRQIRRMCFACGLEVTRLVRLREGELELGALPSGHWRRLTDKELEYIRRLK